MIAKDRSNNPEVRLAIQIVEVLKTGKSSGTAHLELSYRVPWKRAGSQNHPMMWIAYLSMVTPKAKFGPVLTSIKKALAMSFSHGFCGSEIGSRKYIGMIAGCWLIIYNCPHLPIQVRHMVEQWLRFYLLFCASFVDKSGVCRMVGQRSCGTPGLIAPDGAVAHVNGVTVEIVRRRAKCGSPDLDAETPEKRCEAWDWMVLGEFESDIAAIGDGVSANAADCVAEMKDIGYKFAVPYHWLVNANGRLLAVWTDKCINGNTGPVLGWVDGFGWLPAETGWHFRENDRSICRLSGMRLEYSSAEFPGAICRLPWIFGGELIDYGSS